MYQAARGTSDILPEEQPYWRYVEKAIADVTGLYGYRRIDKPIFEETGLFSRSAGEYTDIVQKEMYTFDDRGGNSLTLKPEGTPAVCRAYLQHGLFNLPQPVKLYYVSPIFRYGRPQAGRYRQHHQFGCEAFGEADPAMDAEIIDVAWQFYRSLGLSQITLQLNSIGCKQCRPEYLTVLTDYYKAYASTLCADCKTRLEKNPLRLFDCKQNSCQDIADAAPKNAGYLCPQCDEHFKDLQKYLGLLGIPFVLNHRMVRGLDYYTRTVFEIQPETGSAQSSLGGGGRYDDLIEELNGKPTPAAGFAAGIERIILNLKEQDIPVPIPPVLRVLVAHMGDAVREAAMKLATALRQAGTSAVTTIGDKRLKPQLRQANSLGVPYVIIIGEDEVQSGTATVRDMANARQETVAIGDVPDLLSRLP